MKTIRAARLTSILLFTVTAAWADEPKRDANNTRQNERDRAGQTATPVNQSNAAADLKITTDIRRAVVAEKDLSATAKNVKIITTAGGKVTLRGPVNSEQEKKRIAQLAEAVVPAANVDNELEVKGK
jgi:hyperosmotically inducible protein